MGHPHLDGTVKHESAYALKDIRNDKLHILAWKGDPMRIPHQSIPVQRKASASITDNGITPSLVSIAAPVHGIICHCACTDTYCVCVCVIF